MFYIFLKLKNHILKLRDNIIILLNINFYVKLPKLFQIFYLFSENLINTISIIKLPIGVFYVCLIAYVKNCYHLVYFHLLKY
jgi:hypothetical protein